MKKEDLIEVLREAITMGSQVITSEFLAETNTQYQIYWHADARCFLIGPVTKDGINAVKSDYFENVNKVFEEFFDSEDQFLNYAVELWNNFASTIFFKNTLNPTFNLYLTIQRLTTIQEDGLVDTVVTKTVEGDETEYTMHYYHNDNKVSLIQGGFVIDEVELETEPESLDHRIAEIGSIHNGWIGRIASGTIDTGLREEINEVLGESLGLTQEEAK